MRDYFQIVTTPRISASMVLPALVWFGALSLYGELNAQEPSPRKLTFEVASVRRSAPSVDHYEARFSPGTLIYTGITLRLLIRTAYRIQDPQIIGGPSWLNSARFDISAKIEGSRTPPEILEMLQQLLEERFHLAAQKEMRVLPHYSIVNTTSPAGARPGLMKTNETECVPGSDRPAGADAMPPCGQVRTSKLGLQNRFIATGIPMSQFAMAFTNSMNAWVENNSGLDGKYDIRLNYADDQPATGVNSAGTALSGADDAGLSVFTAFQEQLGLKLQSVKGPVECFVIDHAEMPAEN